MQLFRVKKDKASLDFSRQEDEETLTLPALMEIMVYLVP